MILVGYIILGMFFDGLAMLVVTMPVVFPIISGLGFDPIWFGVICVIVIEMGLITPPVGINVFVVKGVASGVPMGDDLPGRPAVLVRDGRMPRAAGRLPRDRVVPA